MKNLIVLMVLFLIIGGCSAAGVKNQVTKTGDGYAEKGPGPYRTETLTIRFVDKQETLDEVTE